MMEELQTMLVYLALVTVRVCTSLVTEPNLSTPECSWSGVH